MPSDFFPPRPPENPRVYAYSDSQYKFQLKIGYTTRDVQSRLKQQYPILRPGEGLPYRIELDESAMRNDGTSFTDKEVHRYLKTKGYHHTGGEWFEITVEQVRAAILALRNNTLNSEDRNESFAMRPEQIDAVNKTASYFQSIHNENPNTPPHFLWKAKMRFGKTFAAYQLAKKMDFKKVLVLTFKPAVQNAWEEDLLNHTDFVGWQFIKPNGFTTFENADKNQPIVCFGSFQDYLGKNPLGGIKPKNEWVHTTNWDMVIFDEYHFGAWRESAKELFSKDEDEVQYDLSTEEGGEGYDESEGLDYFQESIMPITTRSYLYLSGTPFRAIANGEFIEEQIFNWTYSDEQRAKEQTSLNPNPYIALPRMVMLTYQLPDSIREIALKVQFNEFDLNTFFSASGIGDAAKFTYPDEVQKWLELIRGAFSETTIDNLKLGAKKPPLPFADVRLLNLISHSVWFLPSVASCFAMANLLKQNQNAFYRGYKVVVAAGNKAGMGVKALGPVNEAMVDPLKSRTITLTCGKLTTGVTVRPWTGIFMLRNSSSPETYFQAVFRVQSPWTVKNPDGLNPNHEEVIKEECYLFDFAPDRALRQIADYSCRLNLDETNPEKKVEEFIHFLPVLAYDGSTMRQIDAAGILDIAMSGTTASLLAKRWESALLVNVDDSTLKRILNNQKAFDAIMNIEGFRSLKKDILQTIINKSDSVNAAKKEANEKDPDASKKKELSEEEKETKSLRKQVQEKLIKFAARIPVFMYLTDFREQVLKDVISKLEPELFKKVTGLTKDDFDLLVSLNLFNGPLMNDAVFKFRRYEDSSLVYMGINRHQIKTYGGYDTTLSRSEVMQILEEQISYEGTEEKKLLEESTILPKGEVQKVIETTATDYGMYKCSECGRFVAGFSRAGHVHRSTAIIWIKKMG